jgi:hypothetical protein
VAAALRRAAREQGGPLPSIDVADALLEERLRAAYGRVLRGVKIREKRCPSKGRCPAWFGGIHCEAVGHSGDRLRSTPSLGGERCNLKR